MSTENVLFDAPGPRARLRHNVLTGVGVLLLLGGLWLVYSKMSERNQLQGYQWSPFVTDSAVWSDYLLPGLWETIKAALISMVLAGAYGLVFGMGRLSHLTWVRWVSGVVVEFFRSVPVLLMMVFFFFGWFATATWLPNQYAPLAAVVLGLTLYNGSVIAELVRSGVHSLPAGQAEAGLSIGLSPGQTMRSIQLPQALRAMLPALIGQLVVILKDTALGTIVLYPELLTAAKTLGSGYANTVQAYLVVALVYILINYTLTKVAGFVEGRVKRRQRGGGGAAPLPVTAAAEG
ncbi:amino acid ABC transporter permease [Phycicoccus sp.]|uniref:amino acid ABC transporter permease n=1 Tax=Phycicoccus sp. TaxID=1902410 RepID=UPI002CF6DC9F|nr:amino acid ABC transporter permease [Phycicoccus sp.]HMM96685.1 amino acid ABC transporter permease [Phycicoccus sp.]